MPGDGLDTWHFAETKPGPVWPLRRRQVWWVEWRPRRRCAQILTSRAQDMCPCLETGSSQMCLVKDLKMRSPLDLVRALKPTTGPFKGKEREIWGTEAPGSEKPGEDGQRQRLEGCGRRPANTKDFWQTLEAGRAVVGPPTPPPWRDTALPTRHGELRLPASRIGENAFLYPQPMVICYRSLGKLLQQASGKTSINSDSHRSVQDTVL